VIPYFPTSGDRHGWAIDEDLRLIRGALEGVAREVPLASARVVHSPFWTGLGGHHPGVLARRFVIAHADNPPFFYLTQPEFARVQGLVNLWVARSHEARRQFDALRLPCVHIPYAIDPELFFPIPDRARIRAGLGIPADAYVIGNFHRDSEGADLGKPKAQKCPELMVEVCRGLVESGARVHVLLAGPRRHWIRAALGRAGVPFTFVGDASISGDDFGPNILPREKLNELTNACDLYFVPSRWEGGPQSAMEAAACKIKILCPPFGVARDILEPESFFGSAPEAREKLEADIRSGFLDRTVEPQFERWRASHTSRSMAEALRALYKNLQSDGRIPDAPPATRDAARELCWRLRARLARRSSFGKISLHHEAGGDPDLDEIVRALPVEPGPGAGTLSVAGFVRDPTSLAGVTDLQFAGAGFHVKNAIPGVPVVFPSAQDAVNFRSEGGSNPVLVCPVPRPAEEGDGPLVVHPADLRSSGKIARAMAAGRPVVYPRESAVFYQVFHAGVGYLDGESGPAEILARSRAPELASYALLPGAESVRGFFARFAADTDK